MGERWRMTDAVSKGVELVRLRLSYLQGGTPKQGVKTGPSGGSPEPREDTLAGRLSRRVIDRWHEEIGLVIGRIEGQIVEWCDDDWGHVPGTVRSTWWNRGRWLLWASIIDMWEEQDGPFSYGQCPYYRGVEGGTCSMGCHDEPECQTCRPSEGWPVKRPGLRWLVGEIRLNYRMGADAGWEL